MPNLEKTKNKPGATREAEPTQLYLEVTSLKPSHFSKEDALSTATKKLDHLASSLGLSVEQLLQEAESSAQFREEHFEALTLAKRIARLKK